MPELEIQMTIMRTSERMTGIEAEEVMLGRVLYQEASVPAQLIADRYFEQQAA